MLDGGIMVFPASGFPATARHTWIGMMLATILDGWEDRSAALWRS